MAQTGLGKGLAVRHDFQGDIENLYRRENYRMQILEDKRRRAQLYGQMMKRGHVRGAGPSRELEDYYKEVNKELADFTIKNPGWETDPGLFSEATTIMDKYLNNPIIQKDEQVKQHFDGLSRAAQNGTMSEKEIHQQFAKYNAYLENGGDPYVFVNPRRFTFGEIVAEGVKSIGYDDINIPYVRADGVKATKTIKKPKLGAVSAAVDTLMRNEEFALQIRSEWDDPAVKVRYESPEDLLRHNIEVGLQYEQSREFLDPVSLAIYEKKLKEQGIHESYAANKIRKMARAMGGEEMVFQPDQANIAWTAYSQPGKPMNINQNTGAYFVANDGTVGDKVTYNLSTEAVGSQHITMMDDKPYVATDVVIGLPVNKTLISGIDTYTLSAGNQLIENKLDSLGFTIMKGVTEGIFDISLKGENIAERRYSGMIYMPARTDAQSAEQYDKLANIGSEDRGDLRELGVYRQAQQDFAQNEAVAEHIKVANQLYGPQGWHFSNGMIISEDGTQKYEPETRKRYIKSQ